MKKRILALLLCLTLALSLCVVPALAAEDGAVSAEGLFTKALNKYPTVFVHGLLGWGSYDDIDAVVPYWGMTTGDLTTYLRLKGYECYSASVGPLSSAWDRACELYAQCTGTRTDYGAAHAAKYGHERFGRDYTYDPLLTGWGETDDQGSVVGKLNFVGHSFGGATTRLLLDILADGSETEREYAAANGLELSPFFEGGKGDWVNSLTELAAPHNGTTFIETNDKFTTVASDLFTALGKALGVSALKGVYDFQLEHYGIYKSSNETMSEALERVLASDFLDHNDNAFLDLSIDRALDINKDIEMRDNVYYFSYYGNRTIRNALTGSYIPSSRMFSLLKPFGYRMGKYCDKVTEGSYQDGYGIYEKTVSVTPTYIGGDWLPNDGMVNVKSGMFPFHYENGAQVDDAHAAYGSDQALGKGVWYVMPEVSLDHMGFAGGFLNESVTRIHLFFTDVMKTIESTYV